MPSPPLSAHSASHGTRVRDTAPAFAYSAFPSQRTATPRAGRYLRRQRRPAPGGGRAGLGLRRGAHHELRPVTFAGRVPACLAPLLDSTQRRCRFPTRSPMPSLGCDTGGVKDAAPAYLAGGIGSGGEPGSVSRVARRSCSSGNASRSFGRSAHTFDPMMSSREATRTTRPPTTALSAR